MSKIIVNGQLIDFSQNDVVPALQAATQSLIQSRQLSEEASASRETLRQSEWLQVYNALVAQGNIKVAKANAYYKKLKAEIASNPDTRDLPQAHQEKLAHEGVEIVYGKNYYKDLDDFLSKYMEDRK